MADRGERTEQPTERRIQKAREEGNFPVSREFVGALQFSVFVALLTAFSTLWLAQTRALTSALLRAGFEIELTPAALVRLLRDELLPSMWPLAAAGGLLVGATLAAQLLTTRMGLSTRKLLPDFKRLDPAARLRELPRQNLSQFVHALILLPLFLAAVWAVASENLESFLRLPLLDVVSGTARLGEAVEALLWRAAALFLLIGAVDLVRQRRHYRKNLRMSRQEIREELKEVEGNPQIKARIRRLQRELLRRQMMRQVERATAVVVNPTHYAVALLYEMETMAAPKVVAKGKNYLAQRIRQRALEHGVPIVENAPLAQALYRSVEVGQEIPVHLYRAVAEILAYLYKLMHGRRGAKAAPREA